MKREELLRDPAWWLADTQNRLYGLIYDHMKQKHLKKKDIADQLGVSKGYITQVLKGDFDHKLSKFYELALAFNKLPLIHFVDLDQYIRDDTAGREHIYEKDFEPVSYHTIIRQSGADIYTSYTPAAKVKSEDKPYLVKEPAHNN